MFLDFRECGGFFSLEFGEFDSFWIGLGGIMFFIFIIFIMEGEGDGFFYN